MCKYKNVSFCGLLFISIFFLTACFYFFDPYKNLKKTLKQSEGCKKAILIFKKTPPLTKKKYKKINFAMVASEFCETKNPTASIFFYQYLVNQNILQQKKIPIYSKLASLFEKTRNFKKQADMYLFLRANSAVSYQNHYNYLLAHLYFKIKLMNQSLKFIDYFFKALKMAPQSVKNKDLKKDLLFLKARILLQQKKYNTSYKIFQKIKLQYLTFFKKNQMEFYLNFITDRQKKGRGFKLQ